MLFGIRARYKVKKYIKSDIKYQISNNSKLNAKYQTKQRRIEYVCIGAFIHTYGDDDIICRNTSLPGMKYRPDLIFIRNNTAYHVEIDEFNHSGYDSKDEKARSIVIKNYLTKTYENYVLIRFNPHSCMKLIPSCCNLGISYREQYKAAQKFLETIESRICDSKE